MHTIGYPPTPEAAAIARLLLEEAFEGFDDRRALRPETEAALRHPDHVKAVVSAARDANPSIYGPHMPAGTDWFPVLCRMWQGLMLCIADRHHRGLPPVFPEVPE